MIRNFVKRIGLLALILLFLVFSVSPVRAEEITPLSSSEQIVQIQVVGSSGTTGPTGPTGATGQTGPIGPTGHQDNIVAAQAENSETGAQSTNQNEISGSNQTDLSVNDQSQTDNTADLNLSSGSNTIEHNSVVGSVITGDIDTSVNVLNIDSNSLESGSSVSSTTLDGDNINSLDLTNPATTGNQLILSADLLNSLTGSDSLNLNTGDRNNLINILFNDDSSTDNLLSINADTGNNQILENTKIGNIQTGDINIIANILNLKLLSFPINLGLDIYTVLKGLTGDIIIDNTETGNQSDNGNSVNQSQNAELDINNQSQTNNTFDFDLNSGGNEISRNSSINSVQTGAIAASQNAFNVTNPVFYIINVFGNFLGNVFGLPSDNFIINMLGSGKTSTNGDSQPNSEGSVNASNNQTGDSSTNLNSTDQISDLRADINNNSETNNMINVKANTGKNKITANTVINNVETGAINVMGNIANLYQLLLGGSKNIKIKIINIFGDWTGNLRTPEKTGGQSADKVGPDPEDANSTIEIPTTNQTNPAETSVMDNTIKTSTRHMSTGASYIRSIGNQDLQDVSDLESVDSIQHEPVGNGETTNGSRKALLAIIIPGLVLALSVSSEILDRKRRVI